MKMVFFLNQGSFSSEEKNNNSLHKKANRIIIFIRRARGLFATSVGQMNFLMANEWDIYAYLKIEA